MQIDSGCRFLKRDSVKAARLETEKVERCEDPCAMKESGVTKVTPLSLFARLLR